MIIGCPKEVKTQEYRVGLTPILASKLVKACHRVLIEKSAGLNCGFSDTDYKAAGCDIVERDDIFEQSELIIKVKEPTLEECELFKSGQILFTFLHLAAAKAQTLKLLEKNISAIAYETVYNHQGALPILSPMSEIAGKLGAQEGAYYLKKTAGGMGILLDGATGTDKGEVLVIGAGIAGIAAAKIALGLGANVSVADINLEKLQAIKAQHPAINCLLSNKANIQQALQHSDIVIGAALVPGAKAPILLQAEDLALMQSGSVLVDIAIDQGGCFATSEPTSHEKPVFIKQGIIHYCVTNMPSAAAKTATLALTSATEPYILALAENGLNALNNDKGFLQGLQTHQGKLCNKAVADALNLSYEDVLKL
jgi:alanine dehydrogenase